MFRESGQKVIMCRPLYDITSWEANKGLRTAKFVALKTSQTYIAASYCYLTISLSDIADGFYCSLWTPTIVFFVLLIKSSKLEHILRYLNISPVMRLRSFIILTKRNKKCKVSSQSLELNRFRENHVHVQSWQKSLVTS